MGLEYCAKINRPNLVPAVRIWTGLALIAKPFPKQQILDSSKHKELADDNFKFDENS